MAKITFTKLGIKPETHSTIVPWNDVEIEVQNYLPASKKIEFLTEVINATSGNNFSNAVSTDTAISLAFLHFYTNISFTDKQKEDPGKLYDAFMTSGLLTEILNAIPQNERYFMVEAARTAIESYSQYRVSALGILENLGSDFQNNKINLSDIVEQIKDPEVASFLKDLAPLMNGQN